jgi:hypothetical protein
VRPPQGLLDHLDSIYAAALKLSGQYAADHGFDTADQSNVPLALALVSTQDVAPGAEPRGPRIARGL